MSLYHSIPSKDPLPLGVPWEAGKASNTVLVCLWLRCSAVVNYFYLLVQGIGFFFQLFLGREQDSFSPHSTAVYHFLSSVPLIIYHGFQGMDFSIF